MDGSAVYLLLLVVQSLNSSEQDLFRMIEDEDKLIAILRKTVDIEDMRLQKLEQYRNTLIQHAKIYANEDELAWNPLAIYKTIKHLTVDLEDVKIDMTRKGYRDVREKLEEVATSRGESVLQEEIFDLVRLQRVYNVSAIDMMEGRLASNLTIAPGLRAEDCILIGETSYEKYDIRAAIDWLQGCEDKFGRVAGTRVLGTMLSSALILGDKSLSRKALAACFETDRSNRLLFSTTLVILSKELDIWQNDVDSTEQLEGFLACGRRDDNQLVHLNLKCRYVHHNSPFLILAPLKEEVLSSIPKISLFREAVYKSEIEQMETDAYNEFRIAVFQMRNGLSAYDLAYRPAQRAPLYSDDYLPLSNRLEDISSLSLEKGQSFQMIKYTPGGFFRVHGDLLPSNHGVVKTQGNRLGTTVMYLNDVPSGGNTVFPYLRLSVSPVKGSILFWMNIKADGSKEPLVTHAACPVIYGEKIRIR